MTDQNLDWNSNKAMIQERDAVYCPGTYKQVSVIMNGTLCLMLVFVVQAAAHSQIDSAFRVILTTVFEHDSVAKYALDYSYSKKGAGFFSVNDEFGRWASPDGTTRFHRTDPDSSIYEIFEAKGHKFFVFRSTIELLVHLKPSVKTVVVVKKLKVVRDKAFFRIYTTDLSSAKMYRRKKPRTLYKSIQCDLKKTSSDKWEVINVKLFDIRLREIPIGGEVLGRGKRSITG